MSEPKQRWIHYEGCHEPEIYQSQEDSDKYGSDDDHLHMIEFVAYEQMKADRDAYAKAMAIALENGVFFEKERVKKEIEKALRDVMRE